MSISCVISAILLGIVLLFSGCMWSAEEEWSNLRIFTLQTEINQSATEKSAPFFSDFRTMALKSRCLPIAIAGTYLDYFNGLNVESVSRMLSFSKAAILRWPEYFPPEFPQDVESAKVRNELLVNFFKDKGDAAVDRRKGYTMGKAINRGDEIQRTPLIFLRSAPNVVFEGDPNVDLFDSDLDRVVPKFRETGLIPIATEETGNKEDIIMKLNEMISHPPTAQAASLVVRLFEIGSDDYYSILPTYNRLPSDLAELIVQEFRKGGTAPEGKRRKLFNSLTSVIEGGEASLSNARIIRLYYWLSDMNPELANTNAKKWWASQKLAPGSGYEAYIKGLVGSFAR